MVYYLLDPENSTKSCKSRVQIFIFTLRTLMKSPRPLRACISKKPPSTGRMVLYRSGVNHAVATMVELGGVPGQTVGLDVGLMAHKRVLNFFLPLLQKAERDAELKGLEVHSLIPEHTR